MKPMKFMLLTLSVSASMLAGCGQDKPAETIKTEALPVESTSGDGVYRVMMYPEYKPYQFLDEKGNIVGFDVDMIHAIAKSQGLNIKVESSPWQVMLSRLDTGEADLVISGISRQQAGGDEKYTLSNAYLIGKDAILTKDDVTDIRTFEDMKNRKMGAQIDTIFAAELIKLKGENSPTLVQAPTSFLAFTDLVKGNVEAVYAHENILREYTKSYPDIKFNFLGEGNGFPKYEMVVVAKKGNQDLINKVNAGIESVVSDGSYQKMYAKWFGREPELPTN